ncbi:MAG: glycosyltransferase family 2 protein [Marinagarivorans sp.]|nr:glycosyltransferase family 2 protein [Marinagarivorans sp.]
MKISIITATWNSAKTINATLASLAIQTHQDYEYIVIDGGSSDNTLDVIKESGARVDHLVSEKDKGIYDALNKGIALATGDYVGFLHSDDFFASSLTLSNMHKLLSEKSSDAIYADLEYVDKNDTAKVIRRWQSGDYQKSKLKMGWMPPHPTFYMRRDLYQEFGCFDLTYKIAADYDSLMRYLWVKGVKPEYLPEVTVKMRVGGASNRSLKNIIQKSREDIRVMQSVGCPCYRHFLEKI